MDRDVVIAAAGQAFFSLSLGMGAMLTFASYLTRDHDLPRESLIIASSDFGVAFIAGFMVFPLIFALGLQSDVMGADTGTVAAVVMGAAITLLGLPSAMGLEFLDAMDTLANNVFLIGGALGLGVFTGWVMRDPSSVAHEGTRGGTWTFLWLPLLRFAVPIVLVTILIVSVPVTIEKLQALF